MTFNIHFGTAVDGNPVSVTFEGQVHGYGLLEWKNLREEKIQLGLQTCTVPSKTTARSATISAGNRSCNKQQRQVFCLSSCLC